MPSSVEAELLRDLARWAGSVLALACLLPIETHHDGTRFLWQLAPDLALASAWVLLAPSVAGGVWVLAAWRCRSAVSLASAVVATVLGLFMVWFEARTILARDLLPEPSMLAAGPALALAAVASSVAGATLAPRRAARACLVAATAFALVHLFAPISGEAPALALARVVPHVATRSGWRNLVAACALSVVVVWPVIAAGAAWVRFARPRERRTHLVALALGYGAPVLLAPLVVGALLDPWRDTSPVTALGALAVLGPIVVLLPCAMVVLARDAARGVVAAARSAARPGIGLAAAALVTWLAARPPGSVASFPLGEPTPAAERLFGELLPDWNEGRGDTAQLADEVTTGALSLDARLGAALGALVRESGAPDLSERRFYRLVAAVNDASRRARLPYYVDPTAILGTMRDPARRWPRIDTFRIERVLRSHAVRRDFTTLHVRAMVRDRPRVPAMGLSRDLQPFAVVVLDEIEAYAADLEQAAARAPARCREAPGETAAVERALLACGELLSALAKGGGLREALLDTTSRHELTHQIDGPDLPRSAWLSERTAWAHREHRSRLQRELRAYLAQMALPGPAPALTLVRLARMAAIARAGVEHDVALLALQALGGGARDWPPAWAEAFERLRALDEGSLRDRARRAFLLFGPPV